MEFKVVPFTPVLTNKKDISKAGDAAQQLEKLISSMSDSGWQYVRLESISSYVAPVSGCFGLSNTPGYTTTIQMAVFKKGI